jgi:hypothetical protein
MGASRRLLTLAFLALTAPEICHAQSQLSLNVANGRVTLIAENVPLRAIVEEWHRISGTTFVNADRLDNDSVTLRLMDVTERTAIATLLRGSAGYVAVQSGESGAVGRVLILPRQSAPIVRLPAPDSVETSVVDVPRERVRGIFSPGDPPEFAGPSPLPREAVEFNALTQGTPTASTNKPASTSLGSARPGEITTAQPTTAQPPAQPKQIVRPANLPSPVMRRPPPE